MQENTIKKDIEYDPDVDSIYISGDKGKEILGSITLDNFIIDVEVNNNIVGLEIDNASEFFGVDPSYLSQIKEGSIEIATQRNMLTLRFRIIIDKQKNQILVGTCSMPKNNSTHHQCRTLF